MITTSKRHQVFLLDVENGALELPNDVRSGDHVVCVYSRHYTRFVNQMRERAVQDRVHFRAHTLLNPGKDAADRVLCFYFGYYSRAYPDSHFIIVSCDKGFDGLIDAVRNDWNISCERRNSASAPADQIVRELADTVWARLTKRRKPITYTGLFTAVSSILGPARAARFTGRIIDYFQKMGRITISHGGRVTYPSCAENKSYVGDLST